MRITEFISLREEPLTQAIHEVVETIRQDSPGPDHLRAVLPGSPTHRLLCILAERAEARGREYGPEVGFAHGVMMGVRIGAAYGRRVPAPEEGSGQ